jgi:hypothetical protein
LFLFFQTLALSRAWITKKAAETRQRSHATELEEANTQLWAELAVANAKVAEVKHCEMALIFNYGYLRNNFNDFEAAHATLGKEKENVGKTECEKAQWFHNLLHKKASWSPSWYGKICCHTKRAMFWVSRYRRYHWDMLDWFRMEVQALPTTFTESNEDVTCYAVAGILRMLAGVECGHLSELQRLAISYDALLLHDVLEDHGRIAGRLVRNWWTQHGLPYCMQRVEEDNRVSFVPIPFIAWG